MNTSKLVPFKCLEQQTLLCSEAIHDFSMSSSQSFSAARWKTSVHHQRGSDWCATSVRNNLASWTRKSKAIFTPSVSDMSTTLSAISLLLITSLKRSLGQRNIFTRVCHSVHGSKVSILGSSLCRWSLCRGSLSGRPPCRDSVKSGWCPSYWNAFLLLIHFSVHPSKTSQIGMECQCSLSVDADDQCKWALSDVFLLFYPS